MTQIRYPALHTKCFILVLFPYDKIRCMGTEKIVMQKKKQHIRYKDFEF